MIAAAATASDGGPDAEPAATDAPDDSVARGSDEGQPMEDVAEAPETEAAGPAQASGPNAQTDSPPDAGPLAAPEAIATAPDENGAPEPPPALPPVDPALYAGGFDGRLDSRLELAPDQFAARAEARWNGARTLAGIWIAHPAAPRTMRARIFNLSNGQAADGALYSREGMPADAPLQVSSEAAQALGMRVNRTADIVIVALRQPDLPRTQGEPVPVVAIEIDAPSDGVAPSDMPEAAAPDPDEATEAAAAETDAQDGPEPGRGGGVTGAAQPPMAVGTPAPSAPPPPDPDSDAIPEAMPVADAPADAEGAASPADTARSDPADSGADAPAEPEVAPAGVRDVAAAPASTDDAAPALSTAADDAAAGGFIQVGIFGVPENSTRLIARLADAGVPAEGIALQRQNRALTRVLAGPFGSEAERDRALRLIEEMGIRDARLVSE